MQRDCARIDSRTGLQELVDEFLRSGRRCFVVLEDGSVVGLITPHEVKTVPRERWAEAPVAEAMRPLGELSTVAPTTSVADSLELMARGDVHQLPVVAGGRLEGVISRGDVMRVLKVREELGA
jgi:CBS domain-containing protein